MKPHKHAELIKAWADGAEIERFSYTNRTWEPNLDPTWHEDYEYRIKPEPKPDDERILDLSLLLNYPNPRYRKTGLVKVVFDGETGELKSAEVLK